LVAGAEFARNSATGPSIAYQLSHMSVGNLLLWSFSLRCTNDASYHGSLERATPCVCHIPNPRALRPGLLKR
jgi:hypothetical protein